MINIFAWHRGVEMRSSSEYVPLLDHGFLNGVEIAQNYDQLIGDVKLEDRAVFFDFFLQNEGLLRAVPIFDSRTDEWKS